MPFSGKPLHAGGSNSLVSTIYSTLFKKWRARRMADFERIIQPRPGERILDVGGYHATWQNASFRGCSVDLVNIDSELESKPARALANGLLVREIRGNGCALPFTDGSYDIVYSNSVIEHVGSVEDQLAFAREACRVGKRLWIQTPAVACPIEPHFLGPCIHWVPHRLRPLSARLFSIRGLLGGHSAAQLQELVDHTRLISRKRLREIFPGCQIHTERLLAIIPKSHIITRVP
jgi:ubiquinone/menaquinone biosynthesis C-methylase UbiE